jgi:RNA polymerase sigma-70 factor, ECF subfamily
LNEAELIQGLKNGDSETFKRLVDQYQIPVMNTCMGIVHNRHDAEDLAQDVFMEVFRSVGNFREDSRLSTWIYRIAINKSINFIRKKNRQKWFSPFEGLFTGTNETKIFQGIPESVSSGIENQQISLHLHHAINSLSENQRIAFVLSKYDELSYNEISEVMNLTVSSVESLIHRARVNLQKKLWSFYKKEND